MKHISRLFISFSIAVMALASCQIDPVGPDKEFVEEGIVLRLNTGDLDLTTRADSTRPGDDDGRFNENVLGDYVTVVFFPENATDESSSRKIYTNIPISGGRVSIPVSLADIQTIFRGTVANLKADVFVIANYDGAETINPANSYTIGQLKALNLAKAQWNTFPQSKFVMTGKSTITLENSASNTPARGEINMKRVAAKFTFRLTVADSIVVENITRDHEGNIAGKSLDKWKPIKNAMTVYLQYGMNYAKLGGEPQLVPANAKSSGATDSLYTYKANKLIVTSETKPRDRTIIDDLYQDTGGEWHLVTHHETVNVPVYKTMFTQYTMVDGVEVATETNQDGPFYSYPVSWDPGVATEPFLKLIIPWNNGSATKYYYYKVPFAGTSLEANNWYEVTLDVQVLGGEDELPVPLEATYKIVDWVPGTITEASTVAARYLSVPKTEWVMYNTNELEIPITSSHDVQIVGYEVKPAATTSSPYAAGKAFSANDKALASSWIGSSPMVYNPFTNTRYSIDNQTTVGTIYATRANYNATGMNGAPVPTNTVATSWFATADITRDHIIFRHTLNNDMTTNNYDVAPYYIRIRVQHKDEPANYYRDIIIEQRPAIVIEAQHNSDFGTPNSSGNTTNNGWAYVNGASTQSSSGRNNTNFNMYVIETSVLPTTGSMSAFMLADPRLDNYSARPGNAGANHFIEAATVNRGNNQRLAYYYQAGTDDSYDDYIAPKFRIASSFGASPTMSRNEAIRRCASYQEDGYPAGRWRLPTVAEIKFMAQLTSDNYIPRLLGNTGTGSTYYWCNSDGAAVRIDNAGRQGGVRDPEKQNRTEDSNVRCVYDEWFWENTQYETVTKTVFTWGDQTRENVVRTKAAL